MRYTIQFLSDWHIGSGLSAGAESDAEVNKDENGLPYIPGKTMKGLFKAALLEMPNQFIDQQEIKNIFGYEIIDPKTKKVIRTEPGKAFFSNVCLPSEEANEAKHLSDFLFRNIASTAIGENGIADNHSLRTMEVCMPLTLNGEITGVTEEEKDILSKAAKWLRSIGVNRNRGLGRCKIQIKD
ncbi:MAG: RAMP superfamily protein [Bacteroidetes bacterium ADurb.Bin397]|nr:MAG: RAMP superfamily protein [Bacteroidetes bacterium ADurb.Bin397]